MNHSADPSARAVESAQAAESAWAAERLAAAQARIAPLAERHTEAVSPRLQRVLDAFAAERLGVHHFASVSGYGHGDLGREVLDREIGRAHV